MRIDLKGAGWLNGRDLAVTEVKRLFSLTNPREKKRKIPFSDAKRGKSKGGTEMFSNVRRSYISRSLLGEREGKKDS